MGANLVGSDNGANDVELKKNDPNIIEAREKYSTFLDDNPSSEIGTLDFLGDKENKMLAILNPWDDDSLAILLGEDQINLIEVLKKIVLPNRFSAIWHKDTKDLEVLWTAYPLPERIASISSRSFNFEYKSVEYLCEFSNSSDRALTVALNSIPVSASSTNFRNLTSFRNYVIAAKMNTDEGEEYKGPPLGNPISFWVRNIELIGDELVEFTANLNFYISYFDILSPIIVVHPPKTESSEIHPQTRFVSDGFPKKIKARSLNDDLLRFWFAAKSGDPAQRFLYYFRVLEYASFSFLESNVRHSIHKVLSAPNALDDLKGATEEVIGAVQLTKLDEYQKFEALIRETVKPELLWREVEPNKELFSVETVFDGGFSERPLLAVGSTMEIFQTHGLAQFASAARRIRNALSHGKDQKAGAVITPTIRNFELLQPWVSLMSVAAGEVILYEDLL